MFSQGAYLWTLLGKMMIIIVKVIKLFLYLGPGTYKLCAKSVTHTNIHTLKHGGGSIILWGNWKLVEWAKQLDNLEKICLDECSNISPVLSPWDLCWYHMA